MLQNSTLTQIVITITIFILCFLSTYFYTKVKSIRNSIRINIKIVENRKKLELYTVIFSILAIMLFGYFTYMAILNATEGGSWIWACVKIMIVFIFVIAIIGINTSKITNNKYVFYAFFLGILGIPSILIFLNCNQHHFKDITIKISEKPIFMHVDIWIIAYVLFFLTSYFFKLYQKRNVAKKNSFQILAIIFFIVSIICSFYFYYLMIKSAVEGRSYIITLGQMILFPIIGIQKYLYKKDKLFNIDYQVISTASSVGINVLIFVASLIIYYIVQGKISIQIITVG